MERDDKEIIQEIKAGKASATDELIRKYQKRVFNMAYGLTMNYDAAWDVTQEALIKVVRNIGNFRGDSSFWTYLYRIVMNAHYDLGRKVKVRSKVSNYSDVVNEEEGETFDFKSDVNVEQDVERVMIKENIKKGLEELTQIQRQVFVLKNTQGLKIREVAKVMKISEGTVKSHLSRAFDKLKTVMEV
jgi:RNA polymerase sigma-70 factor, ECF subfamily